MLDNKKHFPKKTTTNTRTTTTTIAFINNYTITTIAITSQTITSSLSQTY